MVLAILYICITIEKLSVGKRSVFIHRVWLHTIILGTLSSLIATFWCRWHTGQRWYLVWGQLLTSIWWRCTSFFTPPPCLQVLCCAMLSMQTAVCLTFTNHSQVCFYPILNYHIARTLQSPCSLFLDYRTWFLYQVLCFLYCPVQQCSIGHFRHIQDKVEVRLF